MISMVQLLSEIIFLGIEEEKVKSEKCKTKNSKKASRIGPDDEIDQFETCVFACGQCRMHHESIMLTTK